MFLKFIISPINNMTKIIIIEHSGGIMFELIWKTTFIYFLILITLRFMGKREIGQLGLFDFVVLLLIADVSAISLEEGESIFICLIPVVTLSLIQKLLAIISLKVNFFRDLIDGKESIIIYKGKLNIKEMRKLNYNIDDLLCQLRLKNVRSLSQVEYLILENSGDISVFLYQSSIFNNVNVKTKSNGAISNSQSSYIIDVNDHNISIFPLVISGKINKENMKLQNINEHWLIEEIHRQGYELKNVYYANIEHNKLFIVQTCSI